MRSYDSWLTDPIDLEYKKFCEGEDFNPIKDPKDAIHTLYEEMFEGQTFDSEKACQALQCLIKHHKMNAYEDVDFDHPNVVTLQALETIRQSYHEQLRDLKKAVTRHLNVLKYELYGNEEIHQSTVNSAISNLEWLTDQECSEKKLNIKRG